jgi:hypothetical protein
VNLFRMILMEMVYRDKYAIIDKSMSDSNVGARKKKNIRNHIFIINGIINEALQNKSKSIDIQILDYRQCFDSMWLKECINDLYEAGVTDDALALIFESNKNNQVAVKTPAGLTKRELVKEIVLQGEVFGPLQCSVQVDSFGKECLSQSKHLYSYRGCVGIPPLAMIDDLLAVSDCGVETVKTNAYLNAKTSTKKLQFGGQKCHKLHVGKTQHVCPELYVDDWKMKKVKEYETGIRNLEDVFDGDFPMEEVQDEKYLGDILTNDGTNTKNVESRKSKGVGAVSQLMSMLEEISFGPFYFQVAMVLRSTLLINSSLTNSEAWYGLTKSYIDSPEWNDLNLLRRIFEVPDFCPKEMLYLETGCLPVSYMIVIRRLMYLQYILHEDESSLIYKFFQSQLRTPLKGDWVLEVQKNLSEYKISTTFEEIKKMSEEKFKKQVKKAVRSKAFEDLIKVKNSHSKVKHIEYKEFKMANYLEPNTLSNIEAKFVFHARCRMLRVKTNYKQSNKELFCPVCKREEVEDSQPHLLECEALVSGKNITQKLPEYNHLFSDKLEDQIKIGRIMKQHFGKRRKILEKEKS